MLSNVTVESIPSPPRLAETTAQGRVAPLIAGVATAIVLLANLIQVDADPDLWGHLLFGLTAIQQGELVVETDPYSYTAQGHAWTNHEWLTEWTFGAVYSAFGATGLVWLRAVLLTSAVLALGTIVKRRNLPPLAILGLAVFAIPVLSQLYRVRPQMFTYTFMAVLLLICDGHRPGRRWQLCLLPGLICVWTNFHAGFVAGLGIFGVHWLGFVADCWNRPDRRRELTFLVGVMFASLAATCLNPYGIAYWKFVFFAVTLPRPEILEWRPIWAQNSTVVLCYLTAVLVPAFVWLRSRRTGYWAETACFAVGAMLAAQHARHLPFLFLFATVLFARRLPELVELHGRRLFGPAQTSRPLAFLAFALLALATLAGGTSKITRQWQAVPNEGALVVTPEVYPIQAVDFLLQNGIAGNLDCGFSWGEYCIFKLYPHCRVFCDGRYETVYPAEVSSLALNEETTPEAWQRRLNDFGTDLILAPPNDRFAAWAVEQGEFVEIYADQTARLLVRRTERYRELIEARKAGRLVPAEKERRSYPFPA